MKKQVLIIIMFILTIFLTGCSLEEQNQQQEKNNESIQTNNTSQIGTLSSIQELKEKMAEESMFSGSLNLPITNGFTREEMARTAIDSSAGGSTKQVSDISSFKEFTGTNNQETQIDEADFVKTNGEFIFTIAGNTLTIVDVKDPEKSEVVFEKEYLEEKELQNIFIRNETLVVIGHINTQVVGVSSDSLDPYISYETQTFVEIYDMSKKQDLELLEEYEVSGNFYDARLIENQVYFISQKSVNVNSPFPTFYRSGTRIAQPDVFYFDMFPSSQYYTISSVDLENTQNYNTQTYLLEYGTTLYVSEDAIYMGQRKQVRDNVTQRFEDVVLPEIESSRRDEFEKYLVNKDFDILAEELENYINDLNDKEEFLNKIQERRNDYYNKQAAEQRKTIIHKFAIDNGSIEYTAEQEIEGHLLNQFSLSEYDGNLRIATTTRNWIQGEGTRTYNNVFILDENLEVIGALEGLAEDEQIYSARFMGEKLYLVTYEQVDPLFVINLSNPQNPTVLGKLKIPGFSSYLHPYGEEHLIGIGKETRENEQGFIETVGLKISLFDVGDVENPIEVDNYIIGGRYTNSIALSDHKAFTFLESQGLLVLPVQEQISKRTYDYYGFKNKAFVFEITETGIDKRGEISHSKANETKNGYGSVYGSKEIKRSIIIDTNIYTISQEEIVITNSQTIEEIASVKLPYSEPKRNYYPYLR